MAESALFNGYKVSTEFNEDVVVSEVSYQVEALRECVLRDVIKLRDDGVRSALIALGWTPPGEVKPAFQYSTETALTERQVMLVRMALYRFMHSAYKFADAAAQKTSGASVGHFDAFMRDAQDAEQLLDLLHEGCAVNVSHHQEPAEPVA